jgi:hypothetical protein
MTLFTIELRMRADQGKSGGTRVVEPAPPTVGCVTGFTPGREAGSLMIRVFSGTVIIEMAGRAVGAEPTVQAGSRVFMATLALNGGMRAPERKPIFVPIRFLLDLLPSSNAVAFLAVAPIQTAMYVRMTVCAAHPDIGEDESGVARSAAQLRMLPLKGIAGGAVVEIRRRTD